MAKEKIRRVWDNAIEDWTATTDGSQGRFIPQGEWTVRLWNDEPEPMASDMGVEKSRARDHDASDSQRVASKPPARRSDWPESHLRLKSIWHAAGFGPRLLTIMKDGFQNEEPDATIRMGKTNTMLYL